MKKLVLGLALASAAFATAPAFAATTHHTRQPLARSDSAYENYAAAPGYNATSPEVVFDNRVIGRDPDPNVRLELMRDPGLIAD